MALLEDLAEKLAFDCMQAQKEIGPTADRLYQDVATHIGTASPSLEEAFLTACRLHMAALRAEDFMARRISALKSGK
ncbi:hypothetical protein [Thioclava sp. GXIMD4216]|uniref:Uncharacterized protein n=1 Tax=Thioclava litoralis TaxID=3076557 RepID=A0ABZ1DXY0_9RHOB|nr:hypothetical protein RPE78_11725 [Thioclava sp. FTW29]